MEKDCLIKFFNDCNGVVLAKLSNRLCKSMITFEFDSEDSIYSGDGNLNIKANEINDIITTSKASMKNVL